MTNKFKNYIIKELNNSEEYMNKVFEYLKKLEQNNSKDVRLQKEIYNICEAGELVSKTIVELECLEDE